MQCKSTFLRSGRVCVKSTINIQFYLWPHLSTCLHLYSGYFDARGGKGPVTTHWYESHQRINGLLRWSDSQQKANYHARHVDGEITDVSGEKSDKSTAFMLIILELKCFPSWHEILHSILLITFLKLCLDLVRIIRWNDNKMSFLSRTQCIKHNKFCEGIYSVYKTHIIWII